MYVKHVYSRGQKKVYVLLRRTAEKRSVPFPLYGQPERRLYGQRTVTNTVKVRSRNGNGTEIFG